MFVEITKPRQSNSYSGEKCDMNCNEAYEVTKGYMKIGRNSAMFVEITKSYSGEKCAMNCKAIHEVTKRYLYVDDGYKIEWLQYNKEAYEKIKAALLKTGKFILLHNNLEKGEEFLINIDHIKEIKPKEEGAEVEILWCGTTNSEYTIETYKAIIDKIKACGEVIDNLRS